MIRDKRITTWVLVISAVLIWGTIIYKAIRRNPDSKVNSEIIISPSVKSMKEKFTYKLLLNYPDPFFWVSEVNKKSQTSTIAKKVAPINWPNLKYNGCVSNKEEVRVHITCEESSLILKPGEAFAENCVVKRICSDSLLIVKGNEKKWYKK